MQVRFDGKIRQKLRNICKAIWSIGDVNIFKKSKSFKKIFIHYDFFFCNISFIIRYYHPERPNGIFISVTDRLMREKQRREFLSTCLFFCDDYQAFQMKWSFIEYFIHCQILSPGKTDVKRLSKKTGITVKKSENRRGKKNLVFLKLVSERMKK